MIFATARWQTASNMRFTSATRIAKYPGAAWAVRQSLGVNGSRQNLKWTASAVSYGLALQVRLTPSATGLTSPQTWLASRAPQMPAGGSIARWSALSLTGWRLTTRVKIGAVLTGVTWSPSQGWKTIVATGIPALRGLSETTKGRFVVGRRWCHEVRQFAYAFDVLLNVFLWRRLRPS